MHLDPDLIRPVYLQEAEWTITVERDFGVCCIVADNDVMLMGKLNHLLEKCFRRNGGSGVIGIIDEHELGSLSMLGSDSLQVWKKPVRSM